MKKITLTSVLALCMACPSFADIAKEANSATCDNSTIGTTTGPANLQADWTANTINLDWYDGNTKLTVGTTSATCTYDSSITLPSTPTVPTGYTFGGWKVRGAAPAQSGFDLSTWNYGTVPSVDADYVAWKPLNGSNGYTVAAAVSSETFIEPGVDHSSSLNNGEWMVIFGNGTVKGVSTCSTQGGDNHNTEWGGNNTDWSLASNALTAGDYNDTDKQYCWCRTTGVDTAGNGNYTSIESSYWVFFLNLQSECADVCALYCATGIIGAAEFRSAVFGQNQ